jgi:transcriptional regulator with XRE-family HTH domain
MSINQRIRFAILSDKKNQSELSKMVGVTPAAMSKYVNGLTKPVDEVLKKLAKVTGLDYEWLKNASGKEPLGFKDFIKGTGLTKEELIEKVNQLESKVEKLQSEVKRLKRENELLERLTAKDKSI